MNCEEGNRKPLDAVTNSKRANKTLFRLRILVFVTLLLATIVLPGLVYFLLKNEEVSRYESEYHHASGKMLEAFLEIRTKLDAVIGLTARYSAHARDHVRAWPFITMSSFGQQGAIARKQSGALLLHTNHYVGGRNVEEWEKFVPGLDSYWIGESLEYQNSVLRFKLVSEGCPKLGSILEVGPTANDTFPIWQRRDDGSSVPVKGPGPFLVRWQSAPVLCEGIQVNEDVWVDWGDTGGNVSFHSESVTIGGFQLAPPGSYDVSSQSGLTEYFSLMLSASRNKPMEYLGDPFNQVYIPIFDVPYLTSRKPAAVMTVWIQWLSYFRSILPSYTKGIVLVLSNSCSGSFTYQVDGEVVTPVGRGDLHDPRYDHLKNSASWNGFKNFGDGTKYGLPLNEDHCQMSLDVYPSAEFQRIYTSSAPVAIAALVAAVLVIVAGTIVLYDRMGSQVGRQSDKPSRIP